MTTTRPQRVHTTSTTTPAADAYDAAQEQLNALEVPKTTKGTTPEQRRIMWDAYQRKLDRLTHVTKLASRAAYTEAIEQGTLITFVSRSGKWQVSIAPRAYRYLYDHAQVDGDAATLATVKTMISLSHRSTFKSLEAAHKAASMAVTAEARRLGVNPARVQYECIV